MCDEDYGDLKGASLGMANSQNSPISPISPISPTTPMSPTTTTPAMIHNDMKDRVIKFCSKNKFPSPEFERDPPMQGSYAVTLIWSPLGETDGFVFKAVKATKKEAENTVAAELYSKVEEWLSTNKQDDVGNVKGELQQLIVKNPTRFMRAKYETEATGLSVFCCRLSVADQLTSEEYATTGKGIGKK